MTARLLSPLLVATVLVAGCSGGASRVTAVDTTAATPTDTATAAPTAAAPATPAPTTAAPTAPPTT
ncbi:MAG: hypothetical protein WCD35_15115, partial [Mycobacteriales bacterium]